MAQAQYAIAISNSTCETNTAAVAINASKHRRTRKLSNKARSRGPLNCLCNECWVTSTFMLSIWRARISILPLRTKLLCVFLVFALWLSNVCQFFGMNFWLWSFPQGTKPTFVALLIPSALWAACFLVPLVAYRIFSKTQGERSVWFWVKSRCGVSLILSIGLLDAFSGLFSIYSAKHVPMIVQTAVIATGSISAYLSTWYFFREKAKRMSVWLVACFVLAVAGVVLASVPQIEASHERDTIDFGWLIIAFLSATTPAVYNVLQGRFIAQFAHPETIVFAKEANIVDKCESPSTSDTPLLLAVANTRTSLPTVPCETLTRLTLLAFDCGVQLFVTAAFFPLDFLPWFGSSTTAKESWSNFVSGADFVLASQTNAIYLVIYCFGYYLNHIAMSFLNLYSPTLGAMVAQLSLPINALFLITVPSWNIYGDKNKIGWTIGCFVILFVAALIYSVYEEAESARQVLFFSEKEHQTVAESSSEEEDADDADVRASSPDALTSTHEDASTAGNGQ